MDFELSPRFSEEDFCRLCLSSIYELRTLFPREANESTNMMMVSKISLLAEVIIVPSEEVNARICSRCLKQLEEFESFRRRCKDSDHQIRQIRAFQQQQANASQTITSSSLQSPGESAVPTRDRFGGIFDVMAYCDVTPGEHRMRFDGFVYQPESLLVWRCEVPACPCQLLVQHDCSKFWVYGTHNHEKISVASDKRDFKKMNQQICAFLNKLRDQIDGTTNNTTEVNGSSNVQQITAGNGQEEICSTPNRIFLYYITNGGSRPSIVFNGHRYHKEATTHGIVPTEIYWRCSTKNCLGMILTTADLRNVKMHKDHNHSALMNESSADTQNDNCVRVATTSLSFVSQPVSTSVTPEETSSLSNLSIPYVTAVPRIGLIENPAQLSSDMGQVESSNREATIRLVSTTKQPCTTATLGSSISNPSMTDSPAQLAKEKPQKRKETSDVSTRQDKLPKLAPKNNSLLSQIDFYRCPNTSGGIILVHKQFVYSFQPTNRHITWQCKTTNCDAKMRSGWQVEYITIYVEHNHGPAQAQVVDLDNYLPIHDALKILSSLNPTKPTQTPSQARNAKSGVNELSINTRNHQRRKSTWC